MPYFEIILDSLKLTWQSKKLWVFGLVLAAFSGISLVLSGVFGGQEEPQPLTSVQTAQLGKYWPWALIAGIVFLVLICFAIVITISAGNGLIFGTDRADKKEKFSVKQGWKIGREKFWKIIGLEIIMGVLCSIIYVLLNAPLENLYKQKVFALAIPLTILALAIAIPFTILTVFIQIYGYREIILENKGVFKSISGAYNLFVDNWKKSILMLLLSIAVIFCFSFILGVLLIFLSLPLFIFTLVMLAVLQKTGLIIGIAILSFLILPIILFFAILASVFKEIVWTKFYNSLLSSRGVPKGDEGSRN